MKQTADLMVSTGLAAAGFEYINMDDCWLTANRSNGGAGPQIPNPQRCKSSTCCLGGRSRAVGLL